MLFLFITAVLGVASANGTLVPWWVWLLLAFGILIEIVWEFAGWGW